MIVYDLLLWLVQAVIYDYSQLIGEKIWTGLFNCTSDNRMFILEIVQAMNHSRLCV